MICTQWIWIVQLYYDDRVIGYYADEYTAERAVKIHARSIDGDPEDYNIFKVPVMQESAWQNMRITA
jgi:hypothetical protein